MRRPEDGLGSIGIQSPRDGLPSTVEIKGAGRLSIANSPHAAFYEEAFQMLPLTRLKGIKQLSIGLVYMPRLRSRDVSIAEIKPKLYETNRFDHTLEVAVLTEAILTQNGLPAEMVKLGIAAALLHDIATPALGDGTMKVDPERLDEEKHWDTVLDEKGRKFLEKHSLDPNVITKTIVNGGVLGEVLDIADRIAYVISDTHEIARTESNHDTDLLRYLAKHPSIGNIYQDVQIRGDEVYFKSKRRLADFLTLRALLRRDFCNNPYSLGRDIALGNIIRDALEEGVTPQRLREIDDSELLSGFRPGVSDQLVRFMPEVEVFSSEEALHEREQELHNANNIVVVGSEIHEGFKPGTAYKVSNFAGSIGVFEQRYRRGNRRVRKIAEETQGIYLFRKRVVSVTST